MNKYWLLVVVGGLFEIGWVSGLKHASAVWEWGLTFAGLLLSFYALFQSTKRLPVGTAYGVFTGIGAAGAVLAESILYGAPWEAGKLALIAAMIVGIVGLKMTTDEASDIPSAQEGGAG